MCIFWCLSRLLRWLNTFPQTSQRPPCPTPGPVLGRPRPWPWLLDARQRAVASTGPRSWRGPSFVGFCSPPGTLGSTSACEKPLSREGDRSRSVRPAMPRSQGMWRWGFTVPGPAETLSIWSAKPALHKGIHSLIPRELCLDPLLPMVKKVNYRDLKLANKTEVAGQGFFLCRPPKGGNNGTRS